MKYKYLFKSKKICKHCGYYSFRINPETSKYVGGDCCFPHFADYRMDVEKWNKEVRDGTLELKTMNPSDTCDNFVKKIIVIKKYVPKHKINKVMV